MSKLTQIRYIDELLTGLLEVTNPNSVEGNSQLFFAQQRKNNSIYYAPIHNEKKQQLYSHYASATIKVRKNSKGEYYPIYKRPDLYCEMLGDKSKKSTELERIAYFISLSTTKEKIFKQIDTKDRLELWLQHKDYSYRIASCFLNGDKLLKQELEKGIITRSIFDIIYTIYQIRFEFYEIIDIKWERIANQFGQDKKFSFNSSVELFKQIICQIIENEYNKCLLPQVQLRAKDKFKVYDLYKEVLFDSSCDELNPIQELNLKKKKQKLHSLTAPKLSDNHWYRKILDFLISEKTKDFDIKKFFDRREDLAAKLFETMRSRKFPKPKDSMMINGVIYEGSDWQSRNRQVNPARKSNKT